MAWHFRHSWSLRRKMASPRGVARLLHFGDHRLHLGSVSVWSPNFRPPALVKASVNCRRWAAGRCTRTPTLAISADSCWPVKAAASNAAPFCAGEGVVDFGAAPSPLSRPSARRARLRRFRQVHTRQGDQPHAPPAAAVFVARRHCIQFGSAGYRRRRAPPAHRWPLDATAPFLPGWRIHQAAWRLPPRSNRRPGAWRRCAAVVVAFQERLDAALRSPVGFTPRRRVACRGRPAGRRAPAGALASVARPAQQPIRAARPARRSASARFPPGPAAPCRSLTSFTSGPSASFVPAASSANRSRRWLPP